MSILLDDALPSSRIDRHPIPPANLGGLPRLGFGLWRFPLASALLELTIALVGCLLYWRSALQTANAGNVPRGRADLVGGWLWLPASLCWCSTRSWLSRNFNLDQRRFEADV